MNNIKEIMAKNTIKEIEKLDKITIKEILQIKEEKLKK